MAYFSATGTSGGSGVKEINFSGYLRYNVWTEYNVSDFKSLTIKNTATDAAQYRIIYITIDGVQTNLPINTTLTFDLSNATTLRISKINDQAYASFEATLQA